MNKSTGSLLVILILLLVLFGVAVWATQTWNLGSGAYTPPPIVINNSPQGGNNVACTMEAKMCPDGSYVGRSGPNCEFAACPAPVPATTTTPTTPSGTLVGSVSLDHSRSLLGLTLTPFEVVEDSRCPDGVQCIWAGTVRLNTRIYNGNTDSNQTLTLGMPVNWSGYIITLIDVKPDPVAGNRLNPSDYSFTFRVKN